MMQNKKIIGITGGSGAGKSHISEKLRELGFFVVDADAVAHESINGKACMEELAREFGSGVVKDGRIDRKKLGKAVFGSPEKLKRLNCITHKYILSDIEDKIRAQKDKTVFVDGAVLIESGMECDITIGVVADKNIRVNRIMQRDGITEEEAKRRISAQQKDSFYYENCDFVITNNGGEPDISDILKAV